MLNIPVPDWLEKDAQQAVEMCPALALRIEGGKSAAARRAPVTIPAPKLRTSLTGGPQANRRQLTAG
jgi:hypothetical protein